ncbi:MAG: S-layer homology domain-containing protein, partial [Firmicutes bacterium]|nr:S-layer homology domain-containing protein [Bacillota bacterium]
MKRRTMLVSAAAVLLLLLIALIPGAALGAGVAYDDVQPGDWYYDAVQYVSDNGLMQGVGNNTFAPGDDVTRGMIVTIIYRLDGSPAVSGDCPFSDVAAGSWYEKAVTWAAANGIVNGYSAASFGPDDSITREQMALIFYNYAKYKGYDVTTTADISSFIDSNNVHDWARDAMSWCTAVGLINGMGGNALAPEGSSTRAQAAAVLMRFEQNVAGKTEPEPKPEPKPTPAPKPSSSSGSPVTSRVQHVAAPAVRENEIAATCEQAGSYDEVVYCSECGIELKRTANTIPALGHKWDEGVETVAPTCTEAGVKTYTCQNDASHTKTEAIAALG